MPVAETIAEQYDYRCSNFDGLVYSNCTGLDWVDIQNNNSIVFLLNGVYGLNLDLHTGRPAYLSDLLQHHEPMRSLPKSVDLAGILGRRMASAEGGLVPSGVGYGKGCPLPSRLEGQGSVVSSPSGFRGRGWKQILAYLEGRRTLHLYLYDKIWGVQFTLASPTPNSGGLVPHRPPVIYAYGFCAHPVLISFQSLSQLNIWISCLWAFRFQSLQLITCQYPWISVTSCFQMSSKDILFSVNLPPFQLPILPRIPALRALILLRPTYLLTYLITTSKTPTVLCVINSCVWTITTRTLLSFIWYESFWTNDDDYYFIANISPASSP